MQQLQLETSERQPKETPLLFSTDSIIRIMKGIKTQTRRTRGLKEINECPNAWEWIGYDNSGRFSFRWIGGDRILNIRCPFGGVGDQIWVKETWRESTGSLYYKASEQPIGHLFSVPIFDADVKWKSAMFMPKRFARLWLTIAEPCRPERLQDISVEDIMAEGLESAVAIGKDGWDSPVDWYKKQWDSLNAKRGYGWNANPYVWVNTFGAFGVCLK